jgi:hypothetical protein
MSKEKKEEKKKRLNRKRSAYDLTPDPGIGAPPLIQPPLPISAPVPVVVPEIQQVMLEGAAGRDVTENINVLTRCLINKAAEIRVTTNRCAAGAVCWNWTFIGGANAHEEDISWAYLYVSQSRFGYNQAIHDVLARRNEDVQRHLTEARRNYKTRMRAAEERAVHESILKALLAFYNIVEDADSDLKIIAYYRKGPGLMYHHFEFDYHDAITITKGYDEELKAFHGKSVLGGEPDDYDKLILGIDINSLSNQHKACIAHLCAKAEELE